MARRAAAGLCLALGALAAPAARAGPPFLTDDPEPVETGHWEVYGFSERTDSDGDRNGVLGGVEVNYGVAPNLQLHVIVPAAFDNPKDQQGSAGLGDIELGVKYRLLNPGDHDWWPEIGIFPLVQVPTGKADNGLGTGATRVFLPIWVQKRFGAWTINTGGGYWIDSGVDAVNYWFAGWQVQRQVTKNLALGAELYYQTSDDAGETPSSGFNVGGVYDLNETYHLLFSVGRGLQSPEENRFSYYLGLQCTF